MELISNDYQKELIKKIINLNKSGGFCVMGNLIDDLVYPEIYIELKSPDNCPVYIRKVHFDRLLNEYGTNGLQLIINELNDKFFEITYFIKKLKDLDYIRFSGEFDINKIGSKVTSIENGVEITTDYILYKFEDKHVINSIYTFSRKRIKITDKLIEYQKNGYKTQEEIDAKKKLKNEKFIHQLTLFSLIIAIMSISITSLWEVLKFKSVQKMEITNDLLKVKVNCCQEKILPDIPVNGTIYFEFDSCGILPSTKTDLNNIIKIFSSRRNLNVVITGHTDSVGNEQYNQKLSLLRAQKIADEFLIQGIDKNRIIVKGYGKYKPRVSNKTYYGRWTNRRVEIALIVDSKFRDK